MKLVMTLLVRDEQDILSANIDYHLNQGVDYFIVTDNNSTDSTMDILDSYVSKGLMHVIREPQDDYSQSIWVTRMARMASEVCSADWVINNDADEFWWPKSGSLREVFSRIPDSFSCLSVKRVNFLPVNEELSIDDSSNGIEFWRQMTVREVESKNSLGNPLPFKVAHRSDPAVIVAQGNHSVTFSGDSATTFFLESPMIIFHFPIRSYYQFENKIKLGGAAYERNTSLGVNVGSTWRELFKLYKQGGLFDWYINQAVTRSDLASGIESGRYISDLRLSCYLKDLYGNKVTCHGR